MSDDKRHIGVSGATLVGIGGILGGGLLILAGTAFNAAGPAAIETTPARNEPPLFEDVTARSGIDFTYRNGEEKIVGVLGVIGPTRLNYARIIPMVDYTAKLIGRLIS